MTSIQRSECANFIRYENDLWVVVFGFGHFSREALAQEFQNVDFCFIKQIHSNTVIAAQTKDLVEADGHWTTQAHRAVTIQTADCLPVMLMAPSVAMGLHVGWRGVVSNIIGEGRLALRHQKQDLSSVWAFVGPHISTDCFEVGVDVAAQLQNSFLQAGGSSKTEVLRPHPQLEKKYVNLYEIAKQQLVNGGVSPSHIVHCNLDTYRDHRFESFRRNGSRGRQWSFCFLKNTT
jgi:YfiH family protein